MANWLTNLIGKKTPEPEIAPEDMDELEGELSEEPTDEDGEPVRVPIEEEQEDVMKKKFTKEEALNQLAFEENKLKEMQKRNIKKAQKCVERCAKELTKLGFALSIHKPEPQITMRPLNVLEWQEVEKENFRNSFLPK
jgi:hypothetical protein